MRSTYREGIKTHIVLTIEDNRIMKNQYKKLGEIEGDLGYTTIEFYVSLQFPIPLSTRKIDNCLGIICDFQENSLMEKGDIPLVICYKVAYALSNSCLSLNYKNLKRIHTDRLFSETSTLIRNNDISSDFLRTHSSRKLPFSIQVIV